MQTCRTALIVAIATLWVAAGSHCRLEVFPGFEFLSCCQHSETEQTPGHHEKECGGDACASLESGLYKLSKPQQAPEQPLLASVAWVVPLAAHELAARPGLFFSSSSAPPELPRIWHFFQRTALPPRAPSFVS